MLRELARIVTLPHWRAHVVRTILTAVGVSLGVTTVVAIADVSKSVQASFREMVDTVAGDTELEVTARVGAVDEAILAAVASTPGVATASGLIERFLPFAGEQGEQLYLLGVDFLGSPVWERQLPRDQIVIDDELVFLAQPDSVAVPRALARRRGFDAGDRIRVVSPNGPTELTVRGLIDDAPATRLFDAAVLLMDLPAAQHMLGASGELSRIAIQVSDGADVEAVRQRLQRTVGGGYEVRAPEARGDQTEQLLFSLRTTLAIMSLGAVIVGAFIVYHTVANSVMQRRRQFALLNACGIGRRTLVQLCVLETLVLTVPGVLVGILMGQLVASVASVLVGTTVSEIWVRVDVAETARSALGVVVGILVGTGTALVTSYVAIRATFAVPTIESLRPAGLASDEQGSVLKPLLIGGALIAAVWLVTWAPRNMGFLGTVATIIGTQALGYIGVAMLAAPVVWLVGMGARRWLSSHLALPAALAAENLPRSPGRSGGTVATIAATMGIAVTVAILVQSHDRMSLGWIEQHFGADLFVGSGSRVRLMAATPMRSEFGDQIAELPGVESVEPFRTVQIDLNGRPVFLQGLSLEDRLAHGGLPMIEGTLEDALEGLAAGEGVLLSDNLAYRLDAHRGDFLDVPTPSGSRRYRIEGTYVDYLGSLDHGAIAVSQEHLEAVWNDRLVNLFRVWLHPTADPTIVRHQILHLLGDAGSYFVLTAGEFVDSIRQVIRRFFAATWALEVVAVLVGVIGVINTQLATVLDRANEITVLRTIGVSRRDIIGSVVIECGVLGLLGGLLGVAVGVFLGAQIVMVSLRLVTGWSMPFIVPLWPLVVGVVAATCVSALAGFVPARTASELHLGHRSTD